MGETTGGVFSLWQANDAPMTQRALILKQQTMWFEGRHVWHLCDARARVCVCVCVCVCARACHINVAYPRLGPPPLSGARFTCVCALADLHLRSFARICVGEGPAAEPHHEVFPEISPALLCRVMGTLGWSFAEVLFDSECPSKTSPKTSRKLCCKLRQNLRPELPPSKTETSPKTCSAETLC